MTSVQKRAKNRMLAVNDRGYVIGEQHHLAKLTDHDVELILDLLDARDVLRREYVAAGMNKLQVDRTLAKAQLSEAGIAAKFEVSRRTIRDLYAGRRRNQVPSDWRSDRKAAGA